MISFERRYEKIPVEIFKESSEANAVIAQRIASLIRERAAQSRKAVLGFSVSSAIIGVLEELIRIHKNEGLSFANVITFNTEAYFPMHIDALQSRYRFMREYLFDSIDIPKENINFPNNQLPKNEIADFCIQYEEKIKELGGIDILIIGDCQLAFNEPGSPYNSRTRLITLNHTTRVGAASDFYGVEHVPYHAITFGIGTILEAKEIYMLAWGEGKANAVHKTVEGDISEQNPASYLQTHKNTTFYIDQAAADKLTRVHTPWLCGTCDWTPLLTKKAVFWLCRKLKKPILKLTDLDYNDNGMSDLVTEQGPASQINIRVFNELQHTITGWPGGKPNTDDCTRPERATPFPKRSVVFSPHPDDDVISMGGTIARLSQHGHEVHLAYQVSGNIAVFDHDAIRFLDFVRDSAQIYGFNKSEAERVYQATKTLLASKKPGEVDPLQIRQVKAAIRRGEAKAACRYVNIPEERVHFLDLPFYETGAVKKNPIGPEDIAITKALLQEVKPHQIYVAGDLSDPHGTHRVCFLSVLAALKELKNEPWMKDCYVWMYRGAWQEWDVAEVDMAVPLSPEEVEAKREAIFKHQSQKDRPLFPGSDSREFWKRAEERNHNTAVLYDELGMAEYQAMEVFVRYDCSKL